MRLDKFLANLKYGSRNDIKKICKNGLVSINDKIVKSSDLNIDPAKDVIKVSGKEVF